MSLMILKLVAALILVLGLILLLQRASRRWGGAFGAGSSAEKIRIVGQRSLGPRMSLALVQVMGHNLLLGVSPQGIRTVADLGAAVDQPGTPLDALTGGAPVVPPPPPVTSPYLQMSETAPSAPRAAATAAGSEFASELARRLASIQQRYATVREVGDEGGIS